MKSEVHEITPVKTMTIEKEFDNFYSGSKDKIGITYRLWHGWDSLEEAKNAILEKEGDPETFAYVCLDGQWNAVSVENLGNALVINKNIAYIRHGQYEWPRGFSGEEKMIPASSAAKRYFEFHNPHVKREWTQELGNDIRKLFDIEIVKGRNAMKIPDMHCLILLGRTMFGTMVPVFKLNVMDLYLSDSPSRWKLWKKGVSYYNYYTGESLTASRKEIERMRREEKCSSETGRPDSN